MSKITFEGVLQRVGIVFRVADRAPQGCLEALDHLEQPVTNEPSEAAARGVGTDAVPGWSTLSREPELFARAQRNQQHGDLRKGQDAVPPLVAGPCLPERVGHLKVAVPTWPGWL